MQREMYTTGEYLQKHPTWGVEDSRWKARQVIKILTRNGIAPCSVAEVGCGAGEVIRQISLAFPNAMCKGFDISPDALQLTRGREAENLSYHLCETSQTIEHFELLLVLDVIEHVEDCFGFMRSLHCRADYMIAKIPLDLSIFSLLVNSPMRIRESAGHLHYFTKATALALLSDAGFEIVDWFYTKGGYFSPHTGLRTHLIAPFRTIATAVAPGLSALVLGGGSIVVLAR